MPKNHLIVLLILLSEFAIAQVCSGTDASGCYCSDTTKSDCDLLPDITASYDAIADSGGYIEYPQVNAGTSIPGQFSDEGRLRLTVAIPNIGIGPLETHAVNWFTCGTDTTLGNPGVCPDGSQPKGLVVQKIYHKTGDSMSFYERNAGAMTYHSLHGHFHLNDVSYYTLRIKKPGQNNPLLWPIIGKTTKNSYCLEDDGRCSYSPGYCRDSSNNILLDSNFANLGITGYHICTPIVQGISPGFFDVYLKEFWGMWINIPPGTCNGNYYIVVEVDPLNHFTESNENNNYIAVPITLTKQDTPGNPVASIYPQGLTTICQGDSLQLKANGGYSHLWSTGDTTQAITVKQAGTYTVTIKSHCGSATSAPVTVTTLSKPSLPVVTGDSICKGDSVLLKAIGTDSVFWYQDNVSTTKIATGTTYHTPPLFKTATYFVENVKRLPGPTYSAGKIDTSGPNKCYQAFNFMVFDVTSSFKLNAVTMYARDTGTITIKLYDWDGYVIYAKNTKLAKGKNRVMLDVLIFPEDNYMITFTGDSIVYGNSSNVSYPYTVPGVLSIRNSSIGKSTYLYFYDWEISAPDYICRSGRVPVTAFVKNSCTIGINTYDENRLDIKVFPNPFHESTTIQLEKCIQGIVYTIYLYDLLGKEIQQLSSASAAGENTLDFVVKGNELSPGIYFYKLISTSTEKQDPRLLYTGKLLAK